MVRHCPRCRSDYRPEIAVCGECGGPLEDRIEGEDPRFAPPAAPPAPDSAPAEEDHQSIYFSHDIRDIQVLANRLAGRGVRFHVGRSAAGAGKRVRYDLLVAEEDRSAAADELHRVLARDAPADELGGLERDFDPERGYLRCPACGAHLGAGATECPGCGLALSDGTVRGCSECGAEDVSEAGDCRVCAAPHR